jgi:hypothetical protein
MWLVTLPPSLSPFARHYGSLDVSQTYGPLPQVVVINLPFYHVVRFSLRVRCNLPLAYSVA